MQQSPLSQENMVTAPVDPEFAAFIRAIVEQQLSSAKFPDLCVRKLSNPSYGFLFFPTAPGHGYYKWYLTARSQGFSAEQLCNSSNTQDGVGVATTDARPEPAVPSKQRDVPAAVSAPQVSVAPKHVVPDSPEVPMMSQEKELGPRGTKRALEASAEGSESAGSIAITTAVVRPHHAYDMGPAEGEQFQALLAACADGTEPASRVVEFMSRRKTKTETMLRRLLTLQRSRDADRQTRCNLLYVLSQLLYDHHTTGAQPMPYMPVFEALAPEVFEVAAQNQTTGNVLFMAKVLDTWRKAQLFSPQALERMDAVLKGEGDVAAIEKSVNLAAVNAARRPPPQAQNSNGAATRNPAATVAGGSSGPPMNRQRR